MKKDFPEDQIKLKNTPKKKDFFEALLDLKKQKEFTLEKISEILKNIGNYYVDKSKLNSWLRAVVKFAIQHRQNNTPKVQIWYTFKKEDLFDALFERQKQKELTSKKFSEMLKEMLKNIDNYFVDESDLDSFAQAVENFAFQYEQNNPLKKTDFFETLFELEEQNKLTPEKISEILKNIDNYFVDKSELNSPVFGGRTPLEFAIQYGFLDLAEFFVNNGADIHQKGLFYFAVKFSQDRKRLLDVLEYLFKNKNPGINSVDSLSGRTALHESVCWESIEISTFLVQNGADPNIENEKGNTSLHLLAKNFACDNTFDDVDYDYVFAARKLAKLIVEGTADINRKTPSGNTVLHIIANHAYGYYEEHNNVSLARFFIENGADPNLTNENGKKASELTRNTRLS